MNRLMRAYLFGVVTGMGAACAYLAGLAWRRQRDQQQHVNAAVQAFAHTLKQHAKGE